MQSDDTGYADLIRRLRETKDEAVDALAAYQQADEDGVVVLVSRQAIDECLPALRARAQAADALEAAVRERDKWERLEHEAAEHVECVICMRSKHFTGEPPYVGWKGLGKALSEDYDALEAAEQERDAAIALVKRYRNETPLGHQPHMIAHEADDLLAQHATAQGSTERGVKRETVRADDQWPDAVSDGLTIPCSRCGEVPKFDYIISDDALWRELIPEDERTGVICLPCLDRIGVAMGIDFADALEEVQFTGTGQTIVMRPVRIIDYEERHHATAQRKGGGDE